MPARYEMSATVKGAFTEVKARVVDALKGQGFGVLTEIDVQKTLKEKLGADMEPYLILGACNPQLAHQALEADRSIGLLLPCNVVLRQEDGDVRVSILDPRTMFEVTDTQTQADLAGLPERGPGTAASRAAQPWRPLMKHLKNLRRGQRAGFPDLEAPTNGELPAPHDRGPAQFLPAGV